MRLSVWFGMQGWIFSVFFTILKILVDRDGYYS